jgi:hypothetical protein
LQKSILLKLVDDNYETLSVILLLSFIGELLSFLLQLTFFMYFTFLYPYRDQGLLIPPNRVKHYIINQGLNRFAVLVNVLAEYWSGGDRL